MAQMSVLEWTQLQELKVLRRPEIILLPRQHNGAGTDVKERGWKAHTIAFIKRVSASDKILP